MAKYSYPENIFDFIIRDRKRYWDFFKANYTVITIILSLIGGLNQVINLFRISPSLLVFYSPKQGLIDGILFLFFTLLLVSIFIILLTSLLRLVYRKKNYVRYLMLFSYLSMLVIYMCYFFVPKFLMLQNLIIVMTLFGVMSIFFVTDSSIAVKNEKDLIDEKRSERNGNRFETGLYLIFLTSTFFTYYTTSKAVFQNNTDNIYNYKNLKNTLEINNFKDYKQVYNNGSYMFFKNFKSGEILILENVILTKDILIK